MIQDIKDRVPVNVLSNNAIRYGIYDEQGNLLRYEYIKREDEPIETGTPINRALFSNIQGDLYTQDRYNKPTVAKGQVSPDGAKVIGNAFPNDWARVSAVEYTAPNGDILTASGSVESTASYRLYYAVDGSVAGYVWQSTASSTVGENKQWIKIKLNNPLNIKKMATYISATTSYFAFTSAIIQGSNDDEKWDDLHTISSKQTSLTEITLDNNNYYQYYRIYLTGTTTSANNGTFLVYEWQTVEYMTKEDQVIHNINLPLTSYEVGKIVNIEGSKYFLAEPDYVEEEFTSNIIPVFTSDDNITNKYGTWKIGTNYSGGEAAYKLFDDSSSTYWYAYKNGTDYSAHIESVVDENNKSFAIKPMEITIDANYHKAITVKGVTPEGITEVIGTTSANTTTTREIQTLSISPNNYYTKIIFVVASYGTAGHSYVHDIKITKGFIRYGVIREEALTSFENPYLNINNLGAKQINGTIVAGGKYSLVYNGESWDILPKDYVTGNYTGTTEIKSSGTQKITLGFRPKVVIVYCAEYGFVDLGADEWYGAIALDGYPALDGGVSGHPAYLTITETGFEAKSTSYNARLNFKDFNYRYIAFK